jgi:hypothetical protein
MEKPGSMRLAFSFSTTSTLNVPKMEKYFKVTIRQHNYRGEPTMKRIPFPVKAENLGRSFSKAPTRRRQNNLDNLQTKK